MKLNERSVVHYATCGVPPDKSGFLMKKSERSGTFHRRWCVLKANLLFLFEERGRREPLGLVVLEGCTVELCESERVDFAFVIRFGPSHTHTLAADTQDEMEDWAKALARASFQYLRLVVRELEKQLEEAQKMQEHGAAEGGGGGGGGGGDTPEETPDPTCRENGIPWNEPEEFGNLRRENSISWNKPNGVSWDGDGGVRGRPPPVPPRRRSPPEVREAHGEMGVSPGTTCFSKLHDWYGKEVAQLRREWLQSQ